MPRTLGERIRYWREWKGLSQAELGRRTGIPQPRISEMESGGNRWRSADTLYRIAKALDITVELLLEGEGYDSTKPADMARGWNLAHVGSMAPASTGQGADGSIAESPGEGNRDGLEASRLGR